MSYIVWRPLMERRYVEATTSDVCIIQRVKERERYPQTISLPLTITLLRKAASAVDVLIYSVRQGFGSWCKYDSTRTSLTYQSEQASEHRVRTVTVSLCVIATLVAADAVQAARPLTQRCLGPESSANVACVNNHAAVIPIPSSRQRPKNEEDPAGDTLRRYISPKSLLQPRLRCRFSRVRRPRPQHHWFALLTRSRRANPLQ